MKAITQWSCKNGKWYLCMKYKLGHTPDNWLRFSDGTKAMALPTLGKIMIIGEFFNLPRINTQCSRPHKYMEFPI